MYYIDPRGRPQSGQVVITIVTHVVRPSAHPSVRLCVRPKTDILTGNHCRLGLFAGRVDHWSCIYLILKLAMKHFLLFPMCPPVRLVL